MPPKKNLGKKGPSTNKGSRSNIANKGKRRQGEAISQTDGVPYPKKQKITVDTLKTDIDTVKNDIQCIKELLFHSDNNGNKDELTPSGSVTPDRTIFKPGQGQSEAQMVPPLQSDPDDPILIQQAEVAS